LARRIKDVQKIFPPGAGFIFPAKSGLVGPSKKDREPEEKVW